MKFPQPIPVRDLARRFNAQLIGEETLLAGGINVISSLWNVDDQ